MAAKDYIDGEGIRFRKETPSSEIKRDALFYAFITPTLNGAFKIKTVQEVKMLSPYRQGWIGRHESQYLKPLELPAHIGPWDFFLLTCPEEAMLPLLSDLVIEDAYADWIPDIWGCHLALIVTSRVRELIEQIDPDFHYFYPMNIFLKEAGEAIPEERYFWVPRRRLWLKHEHGKKEVPPGAWTTWSQGGFSGRQEAWHYQSNEIFRAFVADIPVWVEGLDTFSFAMSRSVFKRFKSEKLTGLLELECKDRFDEDCDRSHNIGHF